MRAEPHRSSQAASPACAGGDATPPGTASLLTSVLRDVSRSFYWTVRVLPASVRTQIGLAYLLARATDTIADTGMVPVAQRAEVLRLLQQRIVSSPTGPRLPFELFVPCQSSRGEQLLLDRIEEALGALWRTEPQDRARMQAVLATITRGQLLDLERFGAASADALAALETDAELDDYTYRVAGCVGEFWTHMCRAHVFPRVRMDDANFLELGIRFGKGLQWVNILRDLPRDLREGRCYLPAQSLAVAGLRPPDLLDPNNEPRLRPIYDAYLDLAQGHLASGWRYANVIPAGCLRLRLACAWPALIGAQTLSLLRRGHFLDSAQRIKVDRSSVRMWMLKSVIYLPWRRRWERLFADASRQE